MNSKDRSGMKGRVIGALVVGLGLALGAVATASGADPVDDPVFYVDGARPEANANPETGEGCVFWSPDRSDFAICGELNPGWTPKSVPGYHRAPCLQAEQILAARSEDLGKTYGFTPEIDPTSCFATERANGLDWFVLFRIHAAAQPKYSRVLVAFDEDSNLEPVISLD